MKEYSLTSGFFDRQRKLVLTDSYLEWENGNLKGQEFTTLYKQDIADFKHGADWIVWYKFHIGRRFSITFKDKRNKELKIGFKSYFAFNKGNQQKYASIVDDVWRLYHSNITDNYLDKIYNQGEVKIQKIKLTSVGIQLSENLELIPWEKVATKEFNGYFVIYDKSNADIQSRVNYNEYGTETLWSVIKTISKG